MYACTLVMIITAELHLDLGAQRVVLLILVHNTNITPNTKIHGIHVTILMIIMIKETTHKNKHEQAKVFLDLGTHSHTYHCLDTRVVCTTYNVCTRT